MRMVGVKVDITERKAAEQRLHEQQRNLAHSSRVSVAGELSSALSHELNQPLAAILANAAAARRFLLHDPPDMKEIGDILEAIAEDNRRAAAVVARFGSLLKRDLASMKPVDINDVVAGALDLVHGDVIARGVSLTKRFGRHLPIVPADAGQLQEVLLNLVSNACDAMEPMPAGTRRLAVTTAATVRAGCASPWPTAARACRARTIEEIFEPFVTSKPQRLGMGLAICRSIVSAHDGELFVDKPAEAGAAFSFTLPAVAAASVPVTRPSAWPRKSDSDARSVGRQDHREAGAAVRDVGGGDRAAVGFDDRPADRQAQPESVRLGGEVGLEQPRQRVRRDPRPGVIHRDRHVAVRGCAVAIRTTGGCDRAGCASPAPH